MIKAQTMYQFTIPKKLYGRDQESILLLESFERISSGYGQILLVPGTSGVGKTALVHELQKPIRERNGLFIKGKFEQYQQNIPYFAFRQALTELCLKLMSDTGQEYSNFKADILQSIGNLGQVLVKFVPEFESLLGAQPPLDEISPQEARHRFTDVFRKFLKVFCKPEHPLVLFLDDWQWADAASCELLRQLQVGVNLRYLMVIVSYRDNEVGSAHPLMLAVNDLRSRDISVGILQVKNITVNDVHDFLTDTLKPIAEDVDGLAAIIHSRTLGNPFFVQSFFIFLHDLNMIWFDIDGNQWKWRINIAEGINLPDNIVELFVLKLRKLDIETQNLFSLAASLGNRFDLEMLSIITGYSIQKCLSLLLTVEAKTLLLPFDSEGVNNPEQDIPIPGKFTFLHDRVQQAAYTMIEPEVLPAILLKIGRLLLTRLQPEQLDERLFEVMNDLNAGSHLIQETTEQMKMVELNIMAAHKANAATAYHSALQFYRAANSFLEKPGFAKQLWLDHHELAMNLYKNRAVCEFLEGDRREAEKCIQLAVDNSISALEKAQVLNILIVQYTLLARYPEAIVSGQQALAALGISLPVDNYEAARDVEIALVRQELKRYQISSLVDLPVMTNPEMLMAAKILITMGPPCYRSHQRLWSVIVPKVVNLTLQYGNIPQVGYSHTAFGGLLGWVDNDYTSAKEFGDLATRLMTGTFQSPTDQSVFYLMIGSSIRHWFKHLSYGSQDYTDAYEIGLRSGNLQYAAYAFGHKMYCQFYQGIPLSGLIQESHHSLEFSRTRLNQWAIDLLEGGLNIFGILSGESSPLDGNIDWADKEFLQRVDDHYNIQVKCIYSVLKTFALLLLGNNEGALKQSDETEPLIYTIGTQGLLPWAEHVFARMLILTALYSKVSSEQQIKWRSELGIMLNRLQIWASNCPENFEHKYLLASAELARIDGQPIEAIKLYDMAIEAAQTGEFIQWEGMANELTYRFWMESGNEYLADVYWKQAYICYNHWGANSKVFSMENEYRVRIVKNIPVYEDTLAPKDKLETEIKNNLLERQIKLLRNYAFQMQQTKLLNEAKTHAVEMAHATHRLRGEIAQRKRTEEKLIETEIRLKAILQSTADGILAVDGNGKIIKTNNRFAELWRIPEELIDSQDDKVLINFILEQLVSPDEFLNKVQKLYNSKDADLDHLSFKDGRTFERFSAPMVKDETLIGRVWSFRDITEAMRAIEEINKQNEKLTVLNTDKDRFISILGHDLKTPFNNILGLSEMLAGEVNSLKTEEIEDIAKYINKSAKSTNNLLDDILMWARTQQGTIPFNPQNLSFADVCMNILEILNSSAKAKYITINYSLADHINVFADIDMLKTVLRNLVSNAIKFTNSGGKITINAEQNSENVIISVSDNGIGINPGILSKLFDISEVLTTKGTSGETGTGLGLLLCKEFVEKHGGKIWVESEVDKGSDFKFTFPMITEQAT